VTVRSGTIDDVQVQSTAVSRMPAEELAARHGLRRVGTRPSLGSPTASRLPTSGAMARARARYWARSPVSSRPSRALCTFPEPSLLGVNAVLMSELTGECNIMIGGLALGLSPQQVRDRFDEIAEFAGIGDVVYLPMRADSSGMGACLRFAISSAATPDVVLIDEVLATGDAEFKAKSKDRIDRIRRQAGTIFLVSHSLATIESICARALWIDEGRLRMDSPAADVCTAYRSATKR